MVVPIGERDAEPAVVTGLAVHPTKPEVVHAVAQNVVLRTTDSGRSWQRFSRGLPRGTPYYPWYGGGLALDPVNPDVLYLATSRRGIYRSADAGGSWAPTNRTCSRDCIGRTYTSPAYGDYLQLAIDPTSSSRLFAGMPYALHRSSDGGDRWRRTLKLENGFGDEVGVPVAVAGDGTVYASGRIYPRGGKKYGVVAVARSRDRGAGWKLTRVLDTGPRETAFVAPGVLAADPQNPNVVLAAAEAGNSGGGAVCARLLKTTDGGATWKRADRGLVPVGRGCPT